MKNYAIALSIFCLAISIVLGSWFISKGISQNKQNNSVQVQSKTYNRLLTANQLASYLGISVGEARKLGLIPGDESGTHTFVLPNIQIGKKIYFSKTAVDKWLLNGNAIINN